MKTSELGVIAVKITGLFCLVIAVFKLDQVIMILSQYQYMREHLGNSFFFALSTILSFTIILIFGLCLLIVGDRVGPYITRDETELPWPQEEKTILQLGVAIIGIFVLAVAVPKLLNSIATIVFFIRSGVTIDTQHVKTQYLPNLIASAVQTIIGAWMFLGSRGIVGIRNIVREAGIKRKA